MRSLLICSFKLQHTYCRAALVNDRNKFNNIIDCVFPVKYKIMKTIYFVQMERCLCFNLYCAYERQVVTFQLHVQRLQVLGFLLNGFTIQVVLILSRIYNFSFMNSRFHRFHYFMFKVQLNKLL